MQAYDLVVIGGGIQGCGVAQAGAAAGFRTLLIEQDDWGCATSSRSSKLIHGGIRYLQSGQFTLVRESLHEREWMLSHCPDLVKRNWFYIPVYHNSRYRPWKIHLGLILYRLLCGKYKHSQFTRLPKSRWPALPAMRQENLQAVFVYQDAQTDDKKLTQRVQRSAERLGADCLSQTELISAQKTGSSYRLQLKNNSKTNDNKADSYKAIEVDTQLLVNASGPWVNQTLARITPTIAAAEIELIQGTHIILDQLISKRCFYLESPEDQRAIFVLPWYGKTLVGTTETDYDGPPEDCRPLESEIDYLLDTLRYYFPEQNFTLADAFSGLRALPKSEASAFSRPRDVMLKIDDRLISLYGGKLTGWRATAERVLREVEKQLGQRKEVDTRKLGL